LQDDPSESHCVDIWQVLTATWEEVEQGGSQDRFYLAIFGEGDGPDRIKTHFVTSKDRFAKRLLQKLLFGEEP
jgi:hypothetical protein